MKQAIRFGKVPTGADITHHDAAVALSALFAFKVQQRLRRYPGATVSMTDQRIKPVSGRGRHITTEATLLAYPEEKPDPATIVPHSQRQVSLWVTMSGEAKTLLSISTHKLLPESSQRLVEWTHYRFDKDVPTHSELQGLSGLLTRNALQFVRYPSGHMYSGDYPGLVTQKLRTGLYYKLRRGGDPGLTLEPKHWDAYLAQLEDSQTAGATA